MAEQAKLTRHTVKNNARAPRGLYDGKGRYREFEPGEVIADVPMTAAARKPLGKHFLFDKAAETVDEETEAADNSDADGLPETKKELEKLAKAEGIDVDAIQGTGANGGVVKADIVKAIEAKRAADATAQAGGIPETNPGPNDDLDNMSDADLRATVKVLTGEDAPEDADRTALLALARGEDGDE